MAERHLESVGTWCERTVAETLYDSRRPVIVGLLFVAAALNLIDVASTLVGLANGFVETYATSLMIIGEAGSLGYLLIKVAFSFLILWNVRFFWPRLAKLGMKSSLVVMALCFVLSAAYVAPVANNMALLLGLSI